MLDPAPTVPVIVTGLPHPQDKNHPSTDNSPRVEVNQRNLNASRVITLTLDGIVPIKATGVYKSANVISAGDPGSLQFSIDGATFSPFRQGMTLKTNGMFGTPLWIFSNVAQTAVIEYTKGELQINDGRSLALASTPASTAAAESVLAISSSPSVATVAAAYQNAIAGFTMRIKAATAGVFTVRLRNNTLALILFNATYTLAIGEILNFSLPFPINTNCVAGNSIVLQILTDATATGIAEGTLQLMPS